jgi:isopentenyl-diphosphate Delta-isomerase
MSRSVTLIDAFGAPTGEMEVVAAHTNPGFLHLACSAVVFGPGGTVLLQRRADHKPTFGGKWSNTCCTHPFAAETPINAARRRLHEELGIEVDLAPAGTFRYRAVDPITGMVEHELDHVSIGTVNSVDLEFTLDPNEVAEVAFVRIGDVPSMDLTPWFDLVFQIALSARNA